jgi:paired small multidrug resistance pump
MDWVVLILASFCEVAGVAAISKFNKKKLVIHVLYMVAGFALSFFHLSFAMKTISS